MTQDELKSRIEIPHKESFWGTEYTIVPKFLCRVLGDGNQLFWFEPMDTRPDYYVFRGDSSWLDNGLFIENLWVIIDALEQQFGDAYYDDDGIFMDEPADWPALSLDSGYSWGAEPWPT